MTRYKFERIQTFYCLIHIWILFIYIGFGFRSLWEDLNRKKKSQISGSEWELLESADSNRGQNVFGSLLLTSQCIIFNCSYPFLRLTQQLDVALIFGAHGSGSSVLSEVVIIYYLPFPRLCPKENCADSQLWNYAKLFGWQSALGQQTRCLPAAAVPSQEMENQRGIPYSK